MEHYIPRFFTNATATYKLYMQDKPKNKNNIKHKVSKKIKDLVVVNFTVEIDSKSSILLRNEAKF